MASYTKIYSFTEALAEKVHNLGSDTLTIALTNTAHTTSWTQLSDLTEVAYTYCSARALTTATSAQTTGTYKLVVNDLTLTASGGDVGAFRYIYIYNDTATNNELVAFYDYGSALTLADGESIKLDFDGTDGVLTLS